MAIDKDVLDQLLAGRDPGELFAKDGLLDELKKGLSERMLAAERDDHLESGGAEGALNRRNGSSRKTMLTSTSKVAIDVSPDLISTVTDAVLDEVAIWRQRPLDAIYPLIFFDAIRVKVRDEGMVRNKAIPIALGVRADGAK